VAAWISLALALASLLGCAGGTKEDILPQDGPTMKEVYDGHFRSAAPAPIRGCKATAGTRTTRLNLSSRACPTRTW
jgi:hypothetical protein